MDLLQAIRQRRSTRAFASESVASVVLNRLIDAAVQAPSAMNAQPWHFTVVRDRTLLDRISSQSKAYMLKMIDAGAAPSGFREHLTNPEFHIFYHAPALILISTRSNDAWAHEDAALAAENLMLAAYSEGLGTCWIGFAQRWLETDEGRRAVSVPDDYRPVAPIIVGHPKGEAAPVQRRPPVVHWIS